MPTEVRLALAFAVAGAMTLALTPVARRVATALDFYDHPRDYKEHEAATPYLGGAAVLAGFVAAALAFAVGESSLWVIVAGAAALWAVGTMDDRIGLSPAMRVAAAAAVAGALWAGDLGWNLGAGAALDLAVTVLWVVGLVNAFNLFDNIDGAASAVGAVTAAGIGVIAAWEGDAHLGALAFGLTGACTGFLPHNLRLPRARIFLGDGGSMVIGLVVAAAAMSLSVDSVGGVSTLLLAIPLVGVALVDTVLVIVSRLRRGISILTGGRDHLTHRLLRRLGSPWHVALVVAGMQAAISAAALAAARSGETAVHALAAVYVVAAVGLIVAFERGVDPATLKAPLRRSSLT